MPRAGISTRLVAASPIPSGVVSGRCWPIRSWTDSAATYGASSQKLTATAFRACSSAVAESVREPVNRQITIALARPSTPEESAQPVSAIDPAAKPAIRPTAPSTVIHARLAHASHRASRAASSHLASGAMPSRRRTIWLTSALRGPAGARSRDGAEGARPSPLWAMISARGRSPESAGGRADPEPLQDHGTGVDPEHVHPYGEEDRVRGQGWQRDPGQGQGALRQAGGGEHHRHPEDRDLKGGGVDGEAPARPFLRGRGLEAHLSGAGPKEVEAVDGRAVHGQLDDLDRAGRGGHAGDGQGAQPGDLEAVRAQHGDRWPRGRKRGRGRGEGGGDGLGAAVAGGDGDGVAVAGEGEGEGLGGADGEIDGTALGLGSGVGARREEAATAVVERQIG